MTLLHRIYIKLYYKFWDTILPKKLIRFNSQLSQKRNLFLYFDYEREFGGYNTNISDSDIDMILKELGQYSYKTTWFTVGKLFRKYPKSIESIVNEGHEIGSHTYSHIPPSRTPKKGLAKDFLMFSSSKNKNISTKGFHSPTGQWSFSLFKLLKENGFIYDVYGSSKKRKSRSHFLYYGLNKRALRLLTVGDDWPLFNKNLPSDEICSYFVELTIKVKKGEVAGIGFHPWVLFSDVNILEGFKSFLKQLHVIDDIVVNPAHYYADSILNKY